MTTVPDSADEQRVYLVYNDLSYPGHSESGYSKHIVAKNRKEASKLAGFRHTHVKWRPWVKCIDGVFIDASTGKKMEIQ